MAYFAAHPIAGGVVIDFFTEAQDPILKLRAQPTISVAIESGEVQIWGAYSCYLHLESGTTIPFAEMLHSRRPAYIVASGQEVRTVFHWEVNWSNKGVKNPKLAECLVLAKNEPKVLALIRPNQRTVDIWDAQSVVVHDGTNTRRFPEPKPRPDIRPDEFYNRGEIIPFGKNNAS